MATAAVALSLVLGGCGGSSSTMPDPAMACTDAGGQWNADSMTCTTAEELAAARAAMQRSAIMTAIGAAETAVAGVDDDSTDSEVSAAEMAVAAARTAIADAADVPAAEKTANTGTVDAIANRLTAAKTSRTDAMADKAEEDMKAATQLGKDLRAALGGAGANTNALANVTATTLGSAGLGVTVADDAGALTGATTVPTLKAGDSAGMLGSWAGTMYSHTATGANPVKNEAVVYTNQGPAVRKPFSGTGGVYTLTSGQTDPDDNGYLGSDATTLLDVSAAADDLAKVRATTFTHSGTQNHAVPTGRDGVYVRGTYDGAPGEFRCATGCSSTNDGSGAPSGLGGTWHFKPDSGAMVSVPDAHYLYFGWWLNKDKDGKPMAASAFTGRVGTDETPAEDGLDPGWTGAFTADTTLTGSATYEGHAAGKYAMSNPLTGTGSGGHFTADAMLEAKFGATGTGVTGTIDNFMANGAEQPWSVALHRAGFGSDGAIAAPVDDAGTTGVDESMGTTWSINGNPAPRSGTWSGMMYDETVDGDDDGSNLPTTVTGTFYSEFSTIGRMVGAFGANKAD